MLPIILISFLLSVIKEVTLYLSLQTEKRDSSVKMMYIVIKKNFFLSDQFRRQRGVHKAYRSVASLLKDKASNHFSPGFFSALLLCKSKSLFSTTLTLIYITLSLITLLLNHFSFHVIALHYNRNVFFILFCITLYV